MLCKLLDVSRSGYYKWKHRQGKENRYERDRKLLTDLLENAHKKHPSYGYHRLAISVTKETGWLFSHNLAHKCCKLAGIHSNARKYRKYRKPGEESVKFRNIVNGRWHVNEPHKLVTSDMTMFRSKGKWYEWTLLVDAYNNEILAHSLTHLSNRSTACCILAYRLYCVPKSRYYMHLRAMSIHTIYLCS